MSTTIIRSDNREAWLTLRSKGIGSSEVGTILGLNKYETPYDLWRRKKGIDGPKAETFAMKAGHYLEDAVSQFWQDATGREVIKRSAIDWIIRCNENPILQVSPDRTFWTGDVKNEKNKGILECKTTQMKVDKDNIPMTWFSQIQYQLGVAELTQGSLAWLISGREFDYIDLELVPDYFEYIKEEVTRFWVDYIQGDKEPEAVNAADVMRKYAQHVEGKIVEITDEAFGYYNKLKEVKAQIKELEETEGNCEEILKMAFGDAEKITYGGNVLATWKTAKDSEKFDASAFKKANPELAAKYTVTVPGQRRFLLK